LFNVQKITTAKIPLQFISFAVLLYWSWNSTVWISCRFTYFRACCYSPCYSSCVRKPTGEALDGLVHEEAHPCFRYALKALMLEAPAARW